MGLPPLEHIECYLDSPLFREIIAVYERELEENAVQVKSLVNECRQMIQATEEFSKAQQCFAQALGNFRFQTIEVETGTEKMIMNSIQTFSQLLFTIEDYRHSMLSSISVQLLQNLERFRKEHIQKTKEEKKRFEKSSERYYKSLEQKLSQSNKKKDSALQDYDSHLEREHAGFRQVAYEYVCRLQDVHAMKAYELMEPIISYISDASTFFHQAYDSAISLKPELHALQFRVQIVRDTQLQELEKQYELKAQFIEEGESGLMHHPEFLKQGLLYVQDVAKKVGLGPTWHRYFCQYRKLEGGPRGKVKQMKFIPVGHHGLLPSSDFMDVKDCVRCKREEVDRRFCFEVELCHKSDTRKYICQALSMEDRKRWMEIMEGREPVFTSLNKVGGVTPQGMNFVRKCIQVIEDRGLEEEGLYRKPGVLPKANKLVKDCVEQGKLDWFNLHDEFEWDTKTLASAVKSYFSKQLGEPLLTYDLHVQFMEAAKIIDTDKKVEALRELVSQLPPDNRALLSILIQHLNCIAESQHNLMQASNLAVIFGPTLMRPERESVATLINIKYQNIVVEVMIEKMNAIFPDTPPTRIVAENLDQHSSVHREDGGQEGPTPPVRPIPRARPPPTGVMAENLDQHSSVPLGMKLKVTEHGQDGGQEGPTPPVRPPVRPSKKKERERRGRALFDCDAEDELELSFKRNEILENVEESDEPDWLVATQSDGKTGLIPTNYIEFLP